MRPVGTALLRFGLDFSRKHHVSRRAEIGAKIRIGASLVYCKICSGFRLIANHSVPCRVFRMGSLYCSEGKGHTFESCRVRQFFLILQRDMSARTETPTLPRSSE